MLALVNAEAEDVDLKNCALGGSIILSTGGSTFVSAEAVERLRAEQLGHLWGDFGVIWGWDFGQISGW